MEEKEGKQSECDDIEPQEIKQEHDVHRKVGIGEKKQQLDSIRTQLDLERRRLEEERRQIELEKDKLSLKDSKSAIPGRSGSQAGSSGSLCVVCGEKATGMHYMAITCESCKIFFRRTAKKHTTLRCTNLDNQGQCDVVNERRCCPACRFQKCLDAGMNMGCIWHSDRLKTRKPSKRPDPAPEPEVKTMKTKHHSSEQEPQEGSQSTAPATGDDSDVVSSSLGAPVTDAGAGAGLRTDAGAGLRTDAGAGLRTDAGAGLRTDAGAGLRTDAGARSRTDAGAGLWTDAGAGLRTDAGAGLRTDAGAGLRTDAGARSRTDAGAGLWTDAGAGLRTDAGARSRTDVGAGLWTDAGAGLRTDASAGLRTDAGAGLRTDAGARSRTDAGAGLWTDAGAGLRTDAGAGLRTDAGARPRTDAACSAGTGVEARTSTCASAGAGASPGAANPRCSEIQEEFSVGHKRLIRFISTAFQNSERIVFDMSKGNFTELRNSHQMKKTGSAWGMTASQQSAQSIATDSSTSSPSMPNPFSALWSGTDSQTQSSDTGRAAQMDLPTSDMASGESAAASVPMATKAAKKEDAPIDLSVPESVGASAASASGGGLPSGFDFDSDMSKLGMEMMLHDLRQMIVFVKALPAYQKLPMTEQATFVKETFPDFWACISGDAYNLETNSLLNRHTDPPEEVFLSDLQLMGGATFMFKYGMQYLINYAKMKLTKEEAYLFCALCILNPDRESFSDLIKQAVAPYYTSVVEVLCASGRINHADQPLWFSQMMSHMAETRKCLDMFKEFLMQTQLQGQSILPLLEEIMDL